MNNSCSFEAYQDSSLLGDRNSIYQNIDKSDSGNQIFFNDSRKKIKFDLYNFVSRNYSIKYRYFR